MRCTNCTETASEVYVYPKGLKSGGIKANGKKVLTHLDTVTFRMFSACKYTPFNRCEISIQDKRWYDCNDSVEIDGEEELDSDKSYMICKTGGGMIYISHDGQIRGSMENWLEGGDDKAIFKSMSEFKERFGGVIEEFANKYGINQLYLEAFVYCESSTGSGFYEDGRLLIRFENYKFVDKAGLSRDLVKHITYSEEYYRVDTNSPWISIHDTANARYNALEWAISHDEEAAYWSISMGFPQIMGFNYETLGYSSTKEMYDDFSTGYTAQINGFFSFVENNSGILKALQNDDIREAIKLYNGPGKVESYLKEFDKYINQ